MQTHRTITTGVTCPRCMAMATLMHARSDDSPQDTQSVIFLCPNECGLNPDQLAGLVHRSRR